MENKKTQTFGIKFSISQTLWDYLTISLSNSTIKQEVNVSGTKYKGGHNFLYPLKPSITYSNPKLFSIGLMYIGLPGSYILHYPVRSSCWNSEAKAYEPIYSQLEEFQKEAYNKLDSYIKIYNLQNLCIDFIFGTDIHIYTGKS